MPPSDDQLDLGQRIADAADRIIRSEGVGKLTMRRLAQEAGVALKTPYNLYGSKTGVLIALLNNATAPLLVSLEQEEGGPVVLSLVGVLDSTKTIFGQHETYFREIFWEVMTSDQPEARAVAHARITNIVIARIGSAKEAGEFSQSVTPDALGGQLGLNLLANMGSWAGGHLSIEEAMDHTKAVWLPLLLMVTNDTVSSELKLQLRAVQSVLGSSAHAD